MTAVLLDDIKVADRHRRDLGDVDALAASIADVGLLQYPVVSADLTLVAGERRIAAARTLGWTEIPVHLVSDLDDAAALLRAERDENTCRKAFTPTEEHSLYEALLALERPRAVERMSDGGKGGKVSHPSPVLKRAKAAAAEAATGKPGRYKTLEKVAEVKAAATDDTRPEPVRQAAREALDEMDATGRVDGAYQHVKRAERIAEAPRQSDAVTGAVDSSQSVQDARYMHAFSKAIAKADDFLAYDAERVGRLADQADITSVEQLVSSTEKFLARMRAARTGLRVVNGGRA